MNKKGDNVLMITIAEDLHAHHHGISKAVHGQQIRRKYGLGPAELRAIINALRTHGYPICSGRVGYWYAKTPTEVKSTVKQLQSRINGIQGAIDGLLKYMEEK